MTVYRAHQLSPLLFAQPSKGAIEGTSAAIQISSSLDKLKQSRELYPIELQAAKIRTDIAQAEMKRNEIMWSETNIQLAAEARKLTAEASIMQQLENIQGMRTRREYQAEFPGKLQQLISDEDVDGLAQHRDEMYARLGENARHLIPMFDQAKKGLSEEKRQKLLDLQTELTHKRLTALDTIKDLKQELKVAVTEEVIAEEKKVRAKRVLGVPLSEMGTGGEKKTRPEKVNKELAEFFAEAAAEVSLDPTKKVMADLYTAVADRYAASGFKKARGRVQRVWGALMPQRYVTKSKKFQEFEQYHPGWARLARLYLIDPLRPGAERMYWKDANSIFRTIDALTTEIDSKDPAVSKKAQKTLEIYLQGMKDYTPRLEEERAAEERAFKLQDVASRLEALESGLRPVAPARRSVITHERGRGYGQPAGQPTGLPSYENAKSGEEYRAPDGTIRKKQ